MQRTDFAQMQCSIARSLAVVGEPWSPLVIRDVFVGINRFDDLQRDLGISRKVLAERLRHLVEAGMLERRRYSERPPRDEYALTAMGSEFVDVLMAMVKWGDRWTAGDAGRRSSTATARAGRSRTPSRIARPAARSSTRPTSTSSPGRAFRARARRR